MKKSKTAANFLTRARKLARDERLRERRIKRHKKLNSPNLSIKERLEREKKKRDTFFQAALEGLDTKPFMDNWESYSIKTRDEVLEFAAKSYGTIDGFELANRAIVGTLEMEDAGVETNLVIDQASRISKYSFFHLILSKADLPQNFKELAMTMFILKDFGGLGVEKASVSTLENVLKNIINNDEGPYPVIDKTNIRRKET